MDSVTEQLFQVVKKSVEQAVADSTLSASTTLQLKLDLVHPDTSAKSSSFLLGSHKVGELRALSSSTNLAIVASEKPGNQVQADLDHGSLYNSADNSTVTRVINSPNHVEISSPRTLVRNGFRSGEVLTKPSAKRRKLADADLDAVNNAATLKLVEGIWENLHTHDFIPPIAELNSKILQIQPLPMLGSDLAASSTDTFSKVTSYCRDISTDARHLRPLEVIVQAHWVDCYDARLVTISKQEPELNPSAHRRQLISEACKAFSWSEKDLRNKAGIWKGYRQIKDVAGWASLVFSGAGIYRACKYRQCFNEASLAKLALLKHRFELAADTIHPQWRSLLTSISQSSVHTYHNHPHDYAVSLHSDKPCTSLSELYRHLPSPFTFTNIRSSVVDKSVFTSHDPRTIQPLSPYTCRSCELTQSGVSSDNACMCYPALYSPTPTSPPPVQVFHTPHGKNNGLLALLPLAPGTAIGEYVGLITNGLRDLDVMQSPPGSEQYQIFQGKIGNFTRFINHSCKPNCKFATFTWLGVQRIVVVVGENGVKSEEEITVDYGDEWWRGLDKVCLCGEEECRYRELDSVRKLDEKV